MGIDIPMGWWVAPAIILLFLLKIAFYVSVGLFWDRKKMPHRFQEWSNRRNPTLEAISKATVNKDK
jgi:hypothetical protein